MLCTAFIPRAVIVRKVEQIERKWQENIKEIGGELKRGLSLRVQKDDHSDDDPFD